MTVQEERLRREAIAARALERLRERQETETMCTTMYRTILSTADPREDLIAVSFEEAH
jgi:hypothetical protein